MNWCRTILDGAIMAAYFNLFAIIIVLADPRIMMCSYPKSIQKAAPPPRQDMKGNCIIYGCILACFCLCLFMEH